MKTKSVFKELSKGQIREIAIMELQWKGVVCWINNNIAVRGRSFIGRKGVPDVAGFDKQTGIAVYCEIKTIRDRLSNEQIDFLTDLKKAGGWAYIASQDRTTGVFTLEPFVP